MYGSLLVDQLLSFAFRGPTPPSTPPRQRGRERDGDNEDCGVNNLQTAINGWIDKLNKKYAEII